jgi:oxygen-independent coproporphyrinogen-3 oxidase
MLLYVHVPFCTRKCRYCAFHSGPPADGDMRGYAALVSKEIRYWGKRLDHPELRTIFFGGGTPSLLPLPLLTNIVTAIRDSFSFKTNLEFTIEANPESLTDWSYLHGIRSLGVNRLSMGVQSTDDEALRLLGRPHSGAEARAAFDTARMVGFQNISVDLIWGLPGQRLSEWLGQLRRVVKWKPDHLSCYGLTIEPGTPLADSDERGELEFAGDEELSKMFIYGAEYLESMGYLQYEISNFARMGFTSRHNLGYWEGRDYLGVGPSAVSTIRGRRWQVPCAPRDYATALRSETLDANAEELDVVTRLKEMIMLRLRTSRGLRLGAYKAMTGRSFTEDFAPMVQALRQNGLIRMSGGYLRLSKTGMVVSDTILANLFDSPVWDTVQKPESAE